MFLVMRGRVDRHLDQEVFKALISTLMISLEGASTPSSVSSLGASKETDHVDLIY